MIRTLTLAMLLGAMAPAIAGTPDIPDDVNARIARAKSEQAVLASERARARLDDDQADGAGSGGVTALDNGCTIAIGNVIEDSKKIGTSAKRETTVIITGDIIQAGNNCR
jgi:hypothetical protein